MLVNTIGPANAKIFLVGEAPGEKEDACGIPFMGPAGDTLNRLLSTAGIMRTECAIGNVARQRPQNNMIKEFFHDSKCTIPKPELINWIYQLRDDIIQRQPNVIIALGRTALWALTGKMGIGDYRGYAIESTLVPGIKVLPTYHPSFINQSDGKPYYHTVLDFRKAVYHSQFPELRYPKFNLNHNCTAREFVDYIDDINADNMLEYASVDIENTYGISHVSEIGVACSPVMARTIKILNGRFPALNENDEVMVYRAMQRLFDHKKIIMQNGSHDIGVLYNNVGLMVKRLWMDTLIAAHCCYPEFPRDLGFLASICLDVYPWKHQSNAPDYNPLDAANTFGIAMYLNKEIDRLGVRKTFDFEMSEIYPALTMQLQGIPIDTDKQFLKMREVQNTIRRVAGELFELLGKSINFSSSKQLAELLYDDLGLQVQYKRRKSKYDERKVTTDKEALNKLAMLHSDNPLFNKVLELKKNITLLRFIGDDGILEDEGVIPKTKKKEKMILSPNKTVHTSYNITGSAVDEEGRSSFGRWSSSKSIILTYGSGNLQNVPPEARSIYAAPPGQVIIQADYVQAEAVIVAYLTNDITLMKMFNDSFGLTPDERKERGYDIHRYTAHTMFGVKIEDVTKPQRQVGKTLRHATNYSAGPKVIANQLKCPEEVARKLLLMYKRTNPHLEQWHKQIQNELSASRILTTPLGRKHMFLGRWGDELFRSAYSYKPQSTIGDMLNLSMVEFYEKFCTNWNLFLQLHDAIYVTAPENDVDDVMRTLRTCMIRPLTINGSLVKVDVDFKVGKYWGEMTEVNYIA
jgi:DNA polymerase